MMVAVCVQHACVNPGNAHYSINQRHRELLTGALFFGQSLQNKKGEKKVLFGWNSCSSEEKEQLQEKPYMFWIFFF